jgi:hypothetical protein
MQSRPRIRNAKSSQNMDLVWPTGRYLANLERDVQ